MVTLRQRQSAEENARELRAISHLSREELLSRWKAAYGSPPPKGMSRRLLERAAAYHLQAAVIGGLSAAVKRRLARCATSAVKTPAGASKVSLSPGTRLVREWNGHSHTIEVCKSGFLWNGRNWRSLSAVALAITGARWSGPRFFGL